MLDRVNRYTLTELASKVSFWNKLILICWGGMFALLVANFATAQEDEDTDAPTPAETDGEQLDYEELVVTGTRLTTPDLSRRVFTITAEMIAARGLVTTEDIIRSIPQNFSSINSATNLNFGSSAIDSNLGALALGISTANLNGFGSGNTLVLLNGKRVAGQAGSSEFFANLRDIPAGFIERVEVSSDGSSSIYGSDAIGGVINIITKKDYQGVQLILRTENSNTSSDLDKIGVSGGYSWDGGGISAKITTTRSDAVATSETGHTTRDYSDMFDGNQDYNFNSRFRLKAAGIGLSRWGPFNLTLGEGNDGRNAQPEDFRPLTMADWATYVEQDSTGLADDTGFSFDIDHQITKRFWMGAEYSENTSRSSRKVTRFGQSSIMVPASNAFNNFGRPVYVNYDAKTEIDLGLIQLPDQTSTSEFDRLVLRTVFEITDSWAFELDRTTSETFQHSIQWMFGTQQDRDFGDETRQARIDELLASSDPNVAVNLFGDGTGQNPTIAEMIVPIAVSRDGSEITELEGAFRGKLMELKDGHLELVLGTVQRREGNTTEGSFFATGLRSPKRDLRAYFTELRVPVIGSGDNIPFVDSLMLSFSLRYDDYDTAGADGRDANGDPNIIEVSFSNTTPYGGFYWVANDTLRFRGSLSESFKAPTFNDLFGTFGGRYPNAYDPLCSCFVPSAFSVFGPNPNLRPEYSDTLSLGVDWTPASFQGLDIKLDYKQIDFQDRIVHSSELQDLLPLEEYAYLPEFFDRAPDGTLIEARSQRVNIARRLSETLNLDAKYVFKTKRGTVTPAVVWLYRLDLYDQVKSGSPKARFIDELIGVDKYKLQGYLTWVRDRLTIDVVAKYTPSYINNAFEGNTFRPIPNSKVPARTTFDMTAKYAFNESLTFRAGGKNILNADFPFTVNQYGQPYDPTRVDLRGRVLYLDLTYEFARK